MKKIVGNYRLGFRNVRLYLDFESEDSHVILTPKDRGATEICVCADCPFYDSVSGLLHEAYELMLIDLSTRYKVQPSFSFESSDYTFIVTHNQLGEAHDRVGTFLSDVYEDFNKVYEKYSRRIQRKKQK